MEVLNLPPYVICFNDGPSIKACIKYLKPHFIPGAFLTSVKLQNPARVSPANADFGQNRWQFLINVCYLTFYRHGTRKNSSFFIF